VKLFIEVFIELFLLIGPPLWSSGQSSWLQIQRSRVRFPVFPDLLGCSGRAMQEVALKSLPQGAPYETYPFNLLLRELTLQPTLQGVPHRRDVLSLRLKLCRTEVMSAHQDVP
jgi:hypothetical protein